MNPLAEDFCLEGGQGARIDTSTRGDSDVKVLCVSLKALLQET